MKGVTKLVGCTHRTTIVSNPFKNHWHNVLPMAKKKKKGKKEKTSV